jgi:hypothetical protein
MATIVDREGRIAAALDALGPVAGRDVVLLDADEGLRAGQLRRSGASLVEVPPAVPDELPPGSADVVVALWSAIRPGEAAAAHEVGEAVRILRPGGRLLVVHDYGRDEVASLLGPAERERQLVHWSDPSGPFLANGFRLRVLHCWWTWDSLGDAAAFLADAFGPAGVAAAASMRRPRLHYKVALYHRDRTASRGAAA